MYNKPYANNRVQQETRAWRTWNLPGFHYVAIKSLSRLLQSQNTEHKEKEYFCMNCLQGFKEESSRDEHVGYCKDNKSVRIEMPHKRPIVEYSDGQFQFKVPFIMYADFESILEPISGLENNPRLSTTRGINVHIPSGWCIHCEFSYSEVKDPLALYRGKDCVRKFCEHVINWRSSLPLPIIS